MYMNMNPIIARSDLRNCQIEIKLLRMRNSVIIWNVKKE